MTSNWSLWNNTQETTWCTFFFCLMILFTFLNVSNHCRGKYCTAEVTPWSEFHNDVLRSWFAALLLIQLWPCEITFRHEFHLFYFAQKKKKRAGGMQGLQFGARKHLCDGGRGGNGSISKAWQMAFPWVGADTLIAFSVFNKALHEFLPPLSFLSQTLPKHQSLHYGHGKLAGSRSSPMFRRLPWDDWN